MKPTKLMFLLLPFVSGKDKFKGSGRTADSPRTKTKAAATLQETNLRHRHLQGPCPKFTDSEECTIDVAQPIAVDMTVLNESTVMCEMDATDMGGYPGLHLVIHVTDQQKATLKAMLDTDKIRPGETKLIFGQHTCYDDKYLYLPPSLDIMDSVYHDESRRRLVTVTGDKPMLAVRVKNCLDEVTPKSVEEISDLFFGTYGDPVNLKTELAACSYGELNVQAGVGNPEEEAPGVLQVKVDKCLTAEHTMADAYTWFQNSILEKVYDKLGHHYLEDYQHIILIVPSCPCWWWAFAWINGSVTMFQGKSFYHTRVQLEELGHNFGMGHSLNADPDFPGEDGDPTCSMASGRKISEDHIDSRCFNAAKNWQLKWFYNDYGMKYLSTNYGPGEFTPTVLNMVGTSEYKERPSVLPDIIHMPVVAKLESGSAKDYFLGFNRAQVPTTHNHEADNELTIHQVVRGDGEYYSTSYLNATLKQDDEAFTIPNFAETGSDLHISVLCTDVDSTPPETATVCITYNPNKLCCMDSTELTDAAAEKFPMCRCQGDCDNDNDCVGDLVCYTREDDNIIAAVPGCAGEGTPGSDYCTDRPSDNYLALKGNTDLPTGAYPLGLCEGDCDNTSDCAPGYVCFKRSGFTKVPCCDGLGARGKDYCIHQDYQGQCNE